MAHTALPTGFARLLATENIAVRIDSQAHTAYFDTAARVLTLPNWDCTERLRDMLVGHEVAHAIFTDDGGDLLAAVQQVGSNIAIAKDYLNVVEDARIDRLIQRRYPGLRRDYKAGMAEMWEKDFFGVKGRNVNDLPFIDRMNCHFKGSPVEIEFSRDEQVFIDRAATIESWDEAIDLARDIYDFVGQQQQDDAGDSSVEVGDGGEGEDAPTGVGEGGDSATADSTSDSTSDDQGNGEGGTESKGEGTADGGESDDDGSNADGEKSKDSKVAGRGGDLEGSKGAPAPASTLRSAEESIRQQVDAKDDWRGNIGNYALPKSVDLDRVIYRYDEILRDVDIHSESYPIVGTEYTEFKSGAKTTVQNLAQMFERKKAAAVNQRSQVAKTGRLDMTNLHKYKMTEDIFLRNRIVVKGKNHGMIVFVDWSGSMCDCMGETVQQAILLAMFCKKVGIPFRIYGFSTWTRPEGADVYSVFTHQDRKGVDNLYLSNFSLLEIFSNKMSNAEFDKMASALLHYYSTTTNSSYYRSMPACLHLGGTPLNDSIVTAMFLAQKFRAETRCDVLNSIWITDGGDGNPFYGPSGTVSDISTGEVYGWDSNNPNAAQGTNLLFRIYKSKVGGNLIGIYLDRAKSIESTIRWSGGTYNAQEKTIKEFKDNHFAQVPHTGYDTYFLMDKKTAVFTGSDLDDLPENATATRAINAFKRTLAKRSVSRPLLNAFTDKISKEMV